MSRHPNQEIRENERRACIQAIDAEYFRLKDADGLYAIGTVNGLRLAKLVIEQMPEVVNE